MKTSELTGAALDWAVAKCERFPNVDNPDVYERLRGSYSPSTDWAQGGPIMDREEITIDYRDNETQARKWMGDKFIEARAGKKQGLIAAMRCRVASKLGDNIDIPEELK